MDTFNFSFFEDKPQESENGAGPSANTSSPASSTSSQSEAAPDPSTAVPDALDEDDPFGFGAFDNSEEGATGIEAEPAFQSDTLAPNAEAEADTDDFDLASLSDFDLSEPDDFPNLAFVPSQPSEAAPPSKSTAIDAEFPDLDIVEESFDFDEPLPAERSPIPEPLLASEARPTSEAEAEPESSDTPEIATVLPPVDTTEIRAAVEPAVFLTSAPAPAPTESEMEEAPWPKVNVAPAPEEKPKAKAARFLTADDPYGEVAPPRERLRVAVLGASGIGKNHARWFARHSCDVVSFLGSNEESVELTAAHLRAHMGFSGKGYSDLGQLLSETQPQAVCIASPSPLHYSQAMQCLEAGLHVLCEKPLVYSPTRNKRENSDSARELLKAAAKRNLVLGTQLQYGAATPILCRLAGVSPFEVGDFAMEIETTNPKSPRDPKELWVDLAPHPLSVAQYLGGDGAEIVPETLQLYPSRSAYTSEVSARFGVRCEGGRLLMCRAIVRWFDKIVDNREPRRRFSFNGRVVQYSGVRSPDGTYIAQYVAPDGYISHYSDPVDYLIGNFVRTCWEEDQLILSAEQGVQNLDWLLATIEKL